MAKILSVLMSLAVALVLLTGSIALPILVRPFYYAHIEPLGLERKSGLSREEIVRAYDEVLDFCVGARSEFSAGVLPFSRSGAEHFADCRVLFILDLGSFAGSAAAVGVLAVIRRKAPIHRFRGRGAEFWGAAGLCVALGIVGVLAAIDFDGAFTAFHSMFFPGKDNWLFDPATDPIITLMPEEFFRNCAILILAAVAASCTAVMLCARKKTMQ